jgi:hypothetical protein
MTARLSGSSGRCAVFMSKEVSLIYEEPEEWRINSKRNIN